MEMPSSDALLTVLGSMNDWQACGSDWPPWHVSEPLQCRAVTEASKTMISVASC
jgi:hypothetical protein